MKVFEVAKPLNMIVARSMTCKYQKMFKRARHLYVYLNRHILNSDPSIILKMAERGCDRGFWGTNERGARQSIMGYLYRIETTPIQRLDSFSWHDWAEKSHWGTFDGLPKVIK